jgi:hypothetical protein
VSKKLNRKTGFSGGQDGGILDLPARKEQPGVVQGGFWGGFEGEVESGLAEILFGA